MTSWTQEEDPIQHQPNSGGTTPQPAMLHARRPHQRSYSMSFAEGLAHSDETLGVSFSPHQHHPPPFQSQGQPRPAIQLHHQAAPGCVVDSTFTPHRSDSPSSSSSFLPSCGSDDSPYTSMETPSVPSAAAFFPVQPIAVAQPTPQPCASSPLQSSQPLSVVDDSRGSHLTTAMPGDDHRRARRASISLVTPAVESARMLVAGNALPTQPPASLHSMAFAGGFVGEGLRAEYVLRRPSNARRQSIASFELTNGHSPQEAQTVSAGLVAAPSFSSSPESELAIEQPAETGSNEIDTTATMLRRNSLPAGGFAEARRSSYPISHTQAYTPLTAIPTLGQALAEGSIGQRKSIQFFLSMLAQNAAGRGDKKRRKKYRSDRKRRRRSDYESSDEDEPQNSDDEGCLLSSRMPSRDHSDSVEPSSQHFGSFDYSASSLVQEGSFGSDLSSDAIPFSQCEFPTASPYQVQGDVAPRTLSEPYVYSSSLNSRSNSTPLGYDPLTAEINRRRSFSSSYCYQPLMNLTPEEQRLRQYHIEQTNKRLEELRQEHLLRLRRMREAEQLAQQTGTQECIGHDCAAGCANITPDCEEFHLPASYSTHIVSTELQPALALDNMPPDSRPVLVEHMNQQSLSQEVTEAQVRDSMAEFEGDFSDFNMCEQVHLESLCRVTTDEKRFGTGAAHAPVGISVPDSLVASLDRPISSVLEDLSVFPTGSWNSLSGSLDSPNCLLQSNQDDILTFFEMEEPGMPSLQ